jgi:2-dehydropantoate 2-reductase
MAPAAFVDLHLKSRRHTGHRIMLDRIAHVAPSTEIVQQMWEKWVFITTGARCTCLMRSTIGDIVAAGATDVVTALEGCNEIPGGQSRPPRLDAKVLAKITPPKGSILVQLAGEFQHGSTRWKRD